MNVAANVRSIPATTRTFMQKKTVRTAIGGWLVCAIALMATNPSKSAYVDYASERFPRTLKQNCNNLKRDISVAGIISLPTSDLCKSFIGGSNLIGGGIFKQIITASSDRQSFFLFSIYTTDVLGRKVKTLGIGKHFIAL